MDLTVGREVTQTTASAAESGYCALRVSGDPVISAATARSLGALRQPRDDMHLHLWLNKL
jgi:hypothetical protein